MTRHPPTVLDRLQTTRLLLARMCAADFDDLDRMHHDPQVMATLGGIRSAAETRQILKGFLAHWDEHGFGSWVVRDMRSGHFAGRGGLRHVTVGSLAEVEVGYGFVPEFWGLGLATELARESVRVGFTVLQRTDLVSFTLTTNRASRRVMEKAGFRYERDLIHANLPHVLYRLTVGTWQATQRHAFPGGGSE